jgi:hypothetical protein
MREWISAHSWAEKAEVEKLRSLEIKRVYAVYALFSLNFSISQLLIFWVKPRGRREPQHEKP